MRSRIEGATLEDNILIRNRVQVAKLSSTLQLLPNHGSIMLTSSSTGTPRYDLQSPLAGVRVRITKDSTSTGLWTVQGSTATAAGATFNKAGNTIITFDALDDNVELEGLSTTEWATVVNNNAAFS